MEFKYYGVVPDLTEAVNYYTELFDADVIKNGKTSGHANLKLFGEITFLLYGREGKREKEDSLIIRFNTQDKELFEKAYERVKNDKTIEIIYDLQKWSWESTKVMKFKDKYGYVWVYEIDAN